MITCITCGLSKSVSEYGMNGAIRRNSCKVCRNAYVLAWHRRNPEKRKKHRNKWNVENAEAMTAYRRAWDEANPHRVAEKTRRYQLKKLSACPAWADRLEMASLYKEARRLSRITGVPHEVDHIIPIQGRDACGLHVPWNLQVIPALHNRSKGNRLLVEFRGQVIEV